MLSRESSLVTPMLILKIRLFFLSFCFIYYVVYSLFDGELLHSQISISAWCFLVIVNLYHTHLSMPCVSLYVLFLMSV